MDWSALHIIFVEGKEIWKMLGLLAAFPIISGILGSIGVDLFCGIKGKHWSFDLTKYVLHFIFRYCFLPAIAGAAIICPIIFILDQIF